MKSTSPKIEFLGEQVFLAGVSVFEIVPETIAGITVFVLFVLGEEQGVFMTPAEARAEIPGISKELEIGFQEISNKESSDI